LSRRVFTLSTRFWGLAKAFHVCKSYDKETGVAGSWFVEMEVYKKDDGWWKVEEEGIKKE